MCSRHGQELPAIRGRISFAGELGERIKANVSQRAWAEWMDLQIKLINEYRLHMGDPAHRQFLAEQATAFFKLDGGDGELGLGKGPEGGL
ncbi:MAG: oxidative damage protection protein [Deltaproteobacteria bacterium]|nr:MAG: oxidative damage protection protein [Deltaproteobacteria bacterium]